MCNYLLQLFPDKLYLIMFIGVRMRSTALAPLCGGIRRCCLNTHIHTQGSQAANHGECKETERSGCDRLRF